MRENIEDMKKKAKKGDDAVSELLYHPMTAGKDRNQSSNQGVNEFETIFEELQDHFRQVGEQ